MARGNQKALAQAKGNKKALEKAKGQRKDGLNAGQRSERDAQALQEKQARKAAQKAAGGGEEDPRGKGGGTKNPGKAKVVKTMTAREAAMKKKKK
eukprot:gene7505-10010_t